MLRDRAYAWLLAYHKASAELNAEQWFKDFYTPDVRMKFGNNPEVRGQEALKGFQAQFSRLERMIHDVDYFDVVGLKIYQKAIIHYTIKGDDPATQTITIPGFAVFSMHDAGDGKWLCEGAEVFIDVTPVQKRMAEKNLI